LHQGLQFHKLFLAEKFSIRQRFPLALGQRADAESPDIWPGSILQNDGDRQDTYITITN